MWSSVCWSHFFHQKFLWQFYIKFSIFILVYAKNFIIPQCLSYLFKLKVIHNIWYTFLGVVQYTFWEVLYIHCCATNRLPFVTNQQTFSNAWNFTMFCLAAFWVPLYREIHFYFSHRLIHIKALYKYIHSVHHRNTDIEPFAGLSMHPVEHLYYYSCVGPSLLIFGTPFAFMWNGLHLILSPAGDLIYKYFL